MNSHRTKLQGLFVVVIVTVGISMMYQYYQCIFLIGFMKVLPLEQWGNRCCIV